MRQLELIGERVELAEFFAHIETCRDRNGRTHGFHPYPAKFIPHIPRELIANYARPGDVILDPMCGSGTVLVEAAISGHRALGVDVNPVAVLVSRAKTARLTPAERGSLLKVAAQLGADGLRLEKNGNAFEREEGEADIPSFRNRELWFQGQVLRELAHARRLINGIGGEEARCVALCAFSAMVVAVSNQESETRWCSKPKKVRAGQALSGIASKLEHFVGRLREFEALCPAEVRVYQADARALPLAPEEAGVVITSPPYANSHDYYLYNKLRLFWLGHDVCRVQDAEIGSRNRHSDRKEGVDVYVGDMKGVLSEVRRVLKRSGIAVFVVADAVIRNVFYDMGELFEGIGSGSGFSIVERFEFAHKRFTSSFQKGFGTRQHKRTHVLVMQKR